MDDVQLRLDETGHGAFVVMDGGDQLGEMVVEVNDRQMIVHHTEVKPKAEGKGLGKKMFTAMVEHAREKSLKVVPLCQFVHTQFKRHPEDYADIWLRGK